MKETSKGKSEAIPKPSLAITRRKSTGSDAGTSSYKEEISGGKGKSKEIKPLDIVRQTYAGGDTHGPSRLERVEASRKKFLECKGVIHSLETEISKKYSSIRGKLDDHIQSSALTSGYRSLPISFDEKSQMKDSLVEKSVDE